MLSYKELRQRYAHMPSSAIADVLHLALVRKRDAGMPGVTSILHPGKAQFPGFLQIIHTSLTSCSFLKTHTIGRTP